jgi:hypothetical protein
LFRPRQADVVARRVGSVGFGFFATPGYLATRGTPRRLTDLARHDHVGLVDRKPGECWARSTAGGGVEGDRSLRPPGYMRWLRELVPAERFVVASSSLPSMWELARAGAGLVLGTIAVLAADAELVRVLPRAHPPAMEIWLASHADVRHDPDVRRAVLALDAMFDREAATLAG